MEAEPSPGDGDLTVTALYTSAAWAWAGFPCAELLLTREAKAVFSVTNGALDLARCLRRSAPSLRWSLAHRHAMIDHLARQAGAVQIVELAAGLSRRGAAFTEGGAARYVEVDLPAMIHRKEALLDRTEGGRRVRARPQLVRIGADVRDMGTADLDALVDPGPVCVIAEGLLMYLEAPAQRALWRQIAEWLAGHPGSTLLFDLVPAIEQPPPGWIGRLLGRLMALFTDGRGFVRDERSRADLVGELCECGFDDVVALDPADLPDALAAHGVACRVPTQAVVFRCRSWGAGTSGRRG